MIPANQAVSAVLTGDDLRELRRLRDSYLRAWGRVADAHMRTPFFLGMMRVGLDAMSACTRAFQPPAPAEETRR